MIANSSVSFGGFTEGRPLFLEIDTQAFQRNIQRVADTCSGASLMVVLKANAYGHGLLEMAQYSGGNDLAVAIPEEMRLLREKSFQNRIWVLEGPFGQSCIGLGDENVIWVVHSLWQLDLFSSSVNSKVVNICLKLDTGMNRLGLNAADFSLALERIESNESLKLFACMTHFSASDLPEKDKVNKQLADFDACIHSKVASDVLISTANSGAVLFYPESHRNIVRPGIVLYGAMPCPSLHDRRLGYKPVMKLKSAVMAIRTVAKGAGVGYGSRWVAPRDSRIATIACGYGDGYPRHAPDGTPIAVYDKISDTYIRAPLVGRVSMDMLTIDITDISSCELGTKVELWGEEVKADEVALLSGTIAYELFCGITARVPRISV